ncbi:hypothetical protein DK26_10430 [Bosea sp. WAO]|uniref:hypothetical protein n=1 Tax=Bosea sp. WAO TaxID=406341 RepID=UPI000748E20D|nr:hypothetical protein [Bosea sp. WAO]KUL95536.1 hypothetical protein DK26_10430 [Bosea sp. WAO]
MVDGSDDVGGSGMEQIEIVLNTLYLCIDYAMKYITMREGAESAAQFKEEMLKALKSGDINMALMEETKTFDFVVSKLEALGKPNA